MKLLETVVDLHKATITVAQTQLEEQNKLNNKQNLSQANRDLRRGNQ